MERCLRNWANTKKKFIFKKTRKLSQKLSSIDLTAPLAKNAVNSTISASESGLEKLEDNEREEIADKILAIGDEDNIDENKFI